MPRIYQSIRGMQVFCGLWYGKYIITGAAGTSVNGRRIKNVDELQRMSISLEVSLYFRSKAGVWMQGAWMNGQRRSIRRWQVRLAKM